MIEVQYSRSIWPNEVRGLISAYLLYGGKLLIPESYQVKDFDDIANFCAHHHVTVLNQTPEAFYAFSGSALRNNLSFPSLRYVIFGGDKLCLSKLKPWWDQFGDTQPQLINMYGITETTVHTTFKRLSIDDADKASIIGKKLSDMSCYVLGKNSQLVPVGCPGELYIGSAGLARGYLNRPELTAERFIENPFIAASRREKEDRRLYKTGDLVRWLPDGQLEYLGRNDCQVKIRGFRIELGEIENNLINVDCIEQAVVVDYQYQGSKILVAYFVMTEGTVLSIEKIKSYLKSNLPDYMIPSAFMELDAIPLTVNGKLDRRALPEPIFSSNTNYIAPSSTLEKQLCELWEGVLGLQNDIGIDSNFFELGGHSLLAAQLALKLEKTFAKPFPLKWVFSAPTVRAQVEIIGEKATEIVDVPVTLDRARLDDLPDHFSPFHQPNSYKYTLITGVTGFVGAFLLADALKRWSEVTCYCLVRAPDMVTGFARIKHNLQQYDLWDDSYKSRIKVILGDLAEPGLGVAPKLMERLAAQIELIIHNGALVNHALPFSEMAQANVESTRELIKLAATGVAKKVQFISTVGIFYPPGNVGDFNERSSIDSLKQVCSDGYGASKWLAENLVLRAMERGLDAQIFRLGRVALSSRTGLGRIDDVPARYIRSCLRLGSYPGRPFIEPIAPVDWVSHAILASAEKNRLNDQHVFHLLGEQQMDWNLALPSSIRRVSVSQWLDYVNSYDGQKILPFASFLSMFKPEKEQNYRELNIDQAITKSSLEQIDISIPVVDEYALGAYTAQLLRKESYEESE